MGVFETGVLFLAGIAAGTINTVVGSGSLVTFPALLAFGYAPVTANMTNNLGVLPGSISGALAYRHELRDQWPRVIRLAGISLVGGLGGALLLLKLPTAAFSAIVPALILLACLLVVIQPWLRKRTLTSAGKRGRSGAVRTAGIFLTGLYGGYFGAAQGVLLMAVLGIVVAEGLQRLNAMKNVMVAAANTSTAVIFILRPFIVRSS